jgi:hypothetical protein
MVLLRVLYQDDGETFAEILWKLKTEIAPELNRVFCVILDDQVNFKSSMFGYRPETKYVGKGLTRRRAYSEIGKSV